MRPCANVRSTWPARAVSILVLVAALAPARSALGHDTGPDDYYAGNPPFYFDCTICHDSYPVNSGDGGAAIDGLPTNFVPGSAYDLFVRIFDPGQSRWGFELTVMSGNDGAGTLVVLDPVETQLSDNPGSEPDFLKQTYDGTHWGSGGPVAWPFRWVAPSLPSVTFYLAGNATDGSDDPSGDYVYTTQAVLSQSPTGTETTTWGKIKALYSK